MLFSLSLCLFYLCLSLSDIQVYMTIVLAPHKFSLHAIINHYEPPMYSGHYTTSTSFVNQKDHTMKSTPMAPKWTREWGQQQSSTAISRDNLPPTVQKTARQQHHLCRWGYSHQFGTELLPTHGPSPSWCGSPLWLNVLFAGNWG